MLIKCAHTTCINNKGSCVTISAGAYVSFRCNQMGRRLTKKTQQNPVWPWTNKYSFAAGVTLDLLFPMGVNRTARNEWYHYPHTYRSPTASTHGYTSRQKYTNTNRKIYPAKQDPKKIHAKTHSIMSCWNLEQIRQGEKLKRGQPIVFVLWISSVQQKGLNRDFWLCWREKSQIKTKGNTLSNIKSSQRCCGWGNRDLKESAAKMSCWTFHGDILL